MNIESVPEYYRPYLKKLEDGSVVQNLMKTNKEFIALVTGVSEEKGDYCYAEKKWSIKEVLQHVIDAERIFCNRALRFARADDTDLPGFDQNDYVVLGKANKRTIGSLLQEFRRLRESTIDMFRSFDEEMLQTVGTANGSPFTAASVGYIIAGHCRHHITLINDRYLS